jgi:hypothetical protein
VRHAGDGEEITDRGFHLFILTDAAWIG